MVSVIIDRRVKLDTRFSQLVTRILLRQRKQAAFYNKRVPSTENILANTVPIITEIYSSALDL
jgi:hypothetical protein